MITIITVRIMISKMIVLKTIISKTIISKVLILKRLIVFNIAMFICASMLGQEKGKSLRVFLIGNSFSQNATRYLPELAREGGHTLELGIAMFSRA